MINDEYRKIVLKKVQEVLKPNGFNKKGSNFFKRTNDVYLIVQIQSSMFSALNNLKLTVNLGVFSTLINETFNASNNPSLVNAHWRERIGFLEESKIDRWWTITNFDEAEMTGREIAEILREKGLLVLCDLDSTAKLTALWKKGQSAGITDYQRLKFLEVIK